MSPTFADKRPSTHVPSDSLATGDSGYHVVGLSGSGPVVGSVMTGTMGLDWGEHASRVLRIFLSERDSPRRPVVEYRDGSIYVDAAQMEIDVPISIRYRGQPAIAVKRPDEAVEFYRLPTRRHVSRST